MTLSEQQTDKRFLLFETQRDPNSDEETNPLHSGYIPTVWSDRLTFTETRDSDDDFWNFTAFDLLMNELRPIRFRKTNKTHCWIDFYPLNDEFVFIVEEKREISHFNVAKFDWDTNEFKLINQIEQEGRNLCILVDKMEPSKFVFQCFRSNQAIGCQLVDGKIEIGEIHQFRNRFFNAYLKDKLIYAEISGQTRVTVYDLMSKKEQTFKIDLSLLTENSDLYHHFEWINERLYASIKFKNAEKCGLVWADLETKRWNYFVDFEASSYVNELCFFDNNLIVDARQSTFGGRHLNKVKYYEIPMRRPHHLRQSAWLRVVKIMKDNGEKDPYNSAKEFLPLNSDLRASWFKDEEND